jgi:hypothetical protein
MSRERDSGDRDRKRSEREQRNREIEREGAKTQELGPVDPSTQVCNSGGA